MRRAVVLLIVSLLGAGAVSALASPAAPGDPEVRTYLVLRFENLAGEPSLDWLSTGLALSLGDYLQGFGSQVVDEEEMTLLMEGGGLPFRATPTLASELEMARAMRASPDPGRPDRMVLGRFEVKDGDVTLMVRSIDLAKEKGRPWLTRTGRLAGLLEVQKELALALALEEGLRISGPRADTLKGQLAGVPLLAFESYCRALADSDPVRRLRLLRRAEREFPGFPAAVYQAASLLAKQERWDEAAAMLERAASPPAQDEYGFHLLRAAVALQEDNPLGAVDEARRALAHSDTPRAHLLLGRALLATGDHDQARAELEKIRSPDPSDPEIQDLRRAIGEGAQASGGAP